MLVQLKCKGVGNEGRNKLIAIMQCNTTFMPPTCIIYEDMLAIVTKGLMVFVVLNYKYTEVLRTLI